jgi:uncharacterized protein involved in exopolysaccharide biosynthesis
VSAAVERDSVLQKLVEFDALQAQAAAEHFETTQRLAAVRKELDNAPARHLSAVRTADDAGVTRDIRNRIMALESKRTELLRKFTPEYRGVVELEAQLLEARSALAAAQQEPLKEETFAANPTREWLDTERARAIAEHASTRARMEALAQTAAAYRDRAQALHARHAEERSLVLELEAAEQKLHLYTQKAEEARISDELDRMRIANVVIAQPPTVDYEPTRNPSVEALPLLVGLALFLSLACALAADLRDRHVVEIHDPDVADMPAPARRVPRLLSGDNFGGSRSHRHPGRVPLDADIAAENPPPPPEREAEPLLVPFRGGSSAGRRATLEEVFGIAAPRRLRTS